MVDSLLFSLAAVGTLVPPAIIAWRRTHLPDSIFWVLTVMAIGGPASLIVWRFGGGWHTGISATLWVTVAASVGLYALIALFSREGRRLGVLLFPYLVLLATLATVWSQAPEQALRREAPTGWIHAHIAISVVTYGLLTLAAIAGLAVLLRERSMKAKRRDRLSNLLPSVAGAESLQVRLLMVSEAVLGFGLLTGIVIEFLETGRLLELDHKTLLVVGGFVLIGVLLFVHHRTGLRGRRAAQIVLTAYLLVTLGYPGVKFIRDVLLS